MKKIISFLIVLFAVADISAQTQQGYVRTITRFNRPSIGLDSVLLKFKDRPRVKSHSKGKFSIDLPGYKEGQGYVLENVVKAGYELKNIGDLKEYGYSTSVPLTIDMYSVKEKNEDQKAIYNKIYHDLSNNFQKRYEQLLDELDATQSDKVSIQKELADLQKTFDNTKSLLEKIASRYATINIEQMTSFERELQMCIEQGNMSAAVELINSEGGIDAIVKDAEQSQKEAIIAKKIINTSNMKVEKAINSLYALYVGSLANLDYKSATSYIYKIANLDTCNFANQIEASLYLRLTGNYDDAFNLAKRAYGIGNTNNNSEQKVEALDNLGDIYLITKDYNNALKYYGNAIKKMIKEGVIYIELDKYDNKIDAVEVDENLKQNKTNVAIGAFTVNEDLESQTDNIGIGVFLEESDEALTYKDSLLLSSLYTKMAMLNTINGNINKANLYMGRYLNYKPTDSYSNSDYWNSYIIQTVTIGNSMVALGQWKLAETLFNQLLVLIQSVKSNDSSWTMLSSIVNARLAQVCANIVDKRNTAIKYAEVSLKDLNRVEDSFVNYEMRTAVYIATAIAYQANNDYDKSFELIDSAKVAYAHSYRQDTLTYCTLLNNTGQLYYKLDKWDKAIACFQEALNTGYDSNNDKSPLRSMLLYNIGQNLREKHMLDSALIYHKQALEIRERMADNSAIGIYTLSESYSGMAWIYYKKNENIKAAELYEKAYEIRREIFGPNNIEVCKMKKNAYYCLYYGGANNNEIKEYFNNYMAKNAFALVNKNDSLVVTPYYLLSVDEWNIDNKEDAFSSYNKCKDKNSVFLTQDKKTISEVDLLLDDYEIELIPVDENEKKQIVRLYNKNMKKIKKLSDGRNK